MFEYIILKRNHPINWNRQNKIYQAVNNYISNAIKYTQVGGEIFVVAKEEGDFINLDAACKSCEFGEISWKSFNEEKRVHG